MISAIEQPENTAGAMMAGSRVLFHAVFFYDMI